MSDDLTLFGVTPEPEEPESRRPGHWDADDPSGPPPAPPTEGTQEDEEAAP